MHKEGQDIKERTNPKPEIRIVALKKAEKGKAKTIVLISKKTEKKASRRNLVKRRIREAVFLFKKQNPKLQDMCFVVSAKTPSFSFDEAGQIIVEHFKSRPYYV